MLSKHMCFLRHIIGMIVALLFSTVSEVAMPMMPTTSHQAEFFQHQHTLTTENASVHFAARAPPIAVANVIFTGVAVAEHGNGVVMYGQDTYVASLSFGADFDAPNRLQDLTPDQLSYQRLLDGIDELDVTTGRNQSVFYSGRGAREAAENHATSNGLTTLEQTSGGKHLDDLRLFDGTVADVGGDQAANVWGRVSSNYASQASGDVMAIVNNPRPTSIFLTQELPTLLQNPNVTQVIVRSTSGAQVSIPRGTAIDDALRLLDGF